MGTGITRKQTPEEKELNKKVSELAALESELAQRELDLATLQAELRAFENRYLRIVGVRYTELDEIEAQIAETQARLNPKDGKVKERNKPALRRKNPHRLLIISKRKKNLLSSNHQKI
jgi:hypothetical protein